MKVGDLVTLSSYGSKRQFNWMLIKESKNLIGLVTEISTGAAYPYKVLWPVSTDTLRFTNSYARRELKYATN
jgi:hypothetical protein